MQAQEYPTLDKDEGLVDVVVVGGGIVGLNIAYQLAKNGELDGSLRHLWVWRQIRGRQMRQHFETLLSSWFESGRMMCQDGVGLRHPWGEDM